MSNNWIDSTLAKMSTEEKVGQILLVGFWCLEGNEERIMERILKYNLGGFFHFTENADVVANFVNEIQPKAKIPMFVACDYESGTGFYIKEGTNFPRPMSRGYFGNKESEYEIAKKIAIEGKAIGANYSFSPVVDVNVNPFCPDVNIRAYTDDPEAVAELGAGYIKGMQGQGMLATAKHFPGNGGTHMDQHISQAIIDYPRDEYERIFLQPFQKAIDEGVGSIMVAHLEVPCLTTEKHPKYGRVVPASMSKEVITDLLKGKMGFDGIVISDALDMGGVRGMYNREQSNLKTLQAGTDVLLNFFPDDFERDFESLCNAVEKGDLSKERLDDAVKRVLKAKTKIGLDKEVNMPLPKPERDKIFAPGLNNKHCEEIAQNALTLLRNIENTLPIESVEGKKVTVYNIFGPENKVLQGQGQMPQTEIISKRLEERGANVNSIEVVSDWPFDQMRQHYEACLDSDYVFVNLFIVPSYAIGSLIPNINGVRLFYKGILTEAKNLVITSFGDPWVMQYFQTASTYLCAFDNTVNSQENVVKAIFGETPIKGKMPVSLKHVFERGDGIEMPAK